MTIVQMPTTKVGRDLDSSPIALVHQSKLDLLYSMPLHSGPYQVEIINHITSLSYEKTR